MLNQHRRSLYLQLRFTIEKGILYDTVPIFGGFRSRLLAAMTVSLPLAI